MAAASEELATLSYERACAVAIRELVPDGQFYAQRPAVRSIKVDPSLNRSRALAFLPLPAPRLPRKPTTTRPQGVPTLRPQWLCYQGPVKEMARLRQVQATTGRCPQRFGDGQRMSATPSSHPPAADPSRPKAGGKSPLAIGGRGLPFGRGIPGQHKLPRDSTSASLHPRRPDPHHAGKGLKVRASSSAAAAFSSCSARLQGQQPHLGAAATADSPPPLR